MEVKAEHSASYVIVVPKVETDSERWACAANNAKLITSNSDATPDPKAEMPRWDWGPPGGPFQP